VVGIAVGQDVMASKRPTQGSNGRRKRRAETEAPNPSTAQQLRGERGFVDFDPWAMLLEQLTEVPEEGVPAERKRSTKGK